MLLIYILYEFIISRKDKLDVERKNNLFLIAGYNQEHFLFCIISEAKCFHILLYIYVYIYIYILFINYF
jgi:hypothetical protein